MINQVIEADKAHIDYFATPTNGSIVSGSITVTGLTLDEIGVTKVELKRDPDPDDSPAAFGSDRCEIEAGWVA